jgi:transposase
MWLPVAALTIPDADKTILNGLVRAPSTPQGIALRARIVLLAGDGFANNAISKKLSVGRPTVLLWRKRFEKKGSSGLLKIEKGRGRKPEIENAVVDAIVYDTLYRTPSDATHWSTRTLAKVHNVSFTFVKKVWDAHGLKPWLVKTFKVSNDPHFIEKLKDVVGLYLNPPEHALVLCLDEKTQIQALDRTQKPLPLTYNHRKTVTHDYKRNGTTTLFAALNILKGEVIGKCIKKHRHQEFLQFLRQIDRTVDPDLEIHCIIDNYATHKHPKIKQWLDHHPRFHFHFIPTSSSWLNLVERWFGEITRKRIKRGSFQSEQELILAIEKYVEENNKNPKPFVWTKSAEEIITKVNNCKSILKTVH